MKRALYVIVAIAVVIVAYIEVFNYLKRGGIKIVEDKTGHILKNDDTYLYYKVLNKRLLNDYEIDFRVMVDNDIKNLNAFMKDELKKMQKHPRKKAKDFVFVLVDPKDDIIKVLSNKAKYKTIFKNIKIGDIKKFVIELEDKFLEYEIQYSKK